MKAGLRNQQLQLTFGLILLLFGGAAISIIWDVDQVIPILSMATYIIGLVICMRGHVFDRQSRQYFY